MQHVKVLFYRKRNSGNCHFVSYKDTNILIDAGLSGKRIMTGLDEINADIEKIKGIFITHEHSDHIKGAGILSRKLDIPIFANVKTWCVCKDKLGNIKEGNIRKFLKMIKFIRIGSWELSHSQSLMIQVML